MNKEVIEKFMANKCAHKECDAVADYLEQHEEALDKLELFEHLAEDELLHMPVYEKEAQLKEILKVKSIQFGWKQWLVAASVLFFVLFSFYKIGMQDVERNTAELRVTLVNLGTDSKWYMLPDSSRVKLEPQSRISYLPNFAFDRELQQMSGQATYYVHPDKERPFRVVYEGVQTRALGTIFSVGSYDQDNLLVELLEGKIVLEEAEKRLDNQVYLSEKSTIVINKKDFTYRLLKKEKSNYKRAWEMERENNVGENTKSSIAWSNQVVNFNGVSNADLFSIMERLFNVTIDIENPKIINGNFTGELFQDENLESFLTSFCQMNGCTFTINEHVIKIK